jgi:hypothetical protein
MSRDNEKDTLYLQMSNLRTEDMASVHAGHTVCRLQCEPRHKPPCRDAQNQQGTLDYRWALSRLPELRIILMRMSIGR